MSPRQRVRIRGCGGTPDVVPALPADPAQEDSIGLGSTKPGSAKQADAIAAELEVRFRDAYDDNGVDRSLIRWNLARTPTERVRAVEATLNALSTLRRLDGPR